MHALGEHAAADTSEESILHALGEHAAADASDGIIVGSCRICDLPGREHEGQFILKTPSVCLSYASPQHGCLAQHVLWSPCGKGIAGRSVTGPHSRHGVTDAPMHQTLWSLCGCRHQREHGIVIGIVCE